MDGVSEASVKVITTSIFFDVLNFISLTLETSYVYSEKPSVVTFFLETNSSFF